MRNKRKGILMASAILGSAAIVSTGFAAWVITTDTTQIAQGNIEVDDVKDERVKLSYKWSGNKDSRNVVFGTDGGTYTYNWLTPSDKPATLEDTLTVTASFINTDVNTGTPTGKITVDFGIYAGGESKVSLPEYNSETLVVAPTLSSEYTLDGEGKATIAVNFTWGAAFGGQNPNKYFNSQAYADDLGTEAYNKLNALAKFEDTYTYKITLKYVASN